MGGEYTKEIDYYSGVAQMPIQEFTNVQDNPFNEIINIAQDYWWVGVIFIVGAITLSIAGWRILKQNAWIKELIKMWRVK